MVVTVTASSRLTGIKSLDVILREATDAPTPATDKLIFLAPTEGWAISDVGEEKRTLGIEIGASVAPITLTLEARDEVGIVRGRAIRRSPIAPRSNYIWRVTLTLDPTTAAADGDAGASGDAGAGDDAAAGDDEPGAATGDDGPGQPDMTEEAAQALLSAPRSAAGSRAR